MRHFKGILVVLILIFLVSPVSSSDEGSKSHWAANPVKIDGNKDDWQGIQMVNYKKLNIDYAFQNDAGHLYCLLIFKDLKKMSTFRQTGITLWLNPDNKKKKKYAINYLRLKLPAATFIAMWEKKNGPMAGGKKDQLLAKKFISVNQIKAVNKKGDMLPDPIRKGNIGCGFTTVSSKEEVMLEIQLPLERQEKQLAGLGSAAGSEVTIGFEWGGTTKAMKKRMLSNDTKARPRKAGGLKSERNWEGMEKGGDNSRYWGGRSRKGPKKLSFWAPFTLAVKK